jgi:LPS-assembly lipoprotein
MKRQGWQTLGCCLLLLSAVGCGFQLRGLAPVSANLAGITVTSNQPYSVLTNQLTMRLASSSANKSASPYRLTITESKPTTQETGISSSTLIRQIQIRYRIEFTVTDASGEIVMPSSRLVATRTTYVNSNELLAGLAQEETLQAEMRAELIQLLLQRLQALPKIGPLPNPLPEGEGTRTGTPSSSKSAHFPSPSGRGLGRGPLAP